MNIEKYSADIVTMDEAVEDAAVPGQQNEEAIGNLRDNKKQIDNDNV